MGIIYKTGNIVDALLNGEVDFIAHVVNCQGKMGSGLALEIRNKIPHAYNVYMQTEMTLGTISNCDGVWNMNAQFYYGYDGKRYLDYGALAQCFNKLSSALWVPKVIGFAYKTGCDRAGGDWDIVLELIEHLVVPYFKDVVIYRLEGA